MSDTFRERLERKYRKYRAILILANAVVGEERRGLDDELETIRRLPTARLRAIARDLDRKYEALVARYGVVANVDTLERLINYNMTDAQPNVYGYISKTALAAALPRYEAIHPTFKLLPPHARLAIDVFGTRRGPEPVEVVILEATLHEDMATLWNATLDAHAEVGKTRRPRLIKHADALLRASAKAAFNLLEGYINGIALDIVLLEKPVSEQEMTLLSEYDDGKKRPRMLSLRDKLLQYPKIAISAQHPPVQETSCKAMADVLELEKRVRHALIHPNALVDTRKPQDFREVVLLTLALSEVARLCDAVISVIASIAAAVGAEFGDSSTWLIPRGDDGRFPDDLFA